MGRFKPRALILDMDGLMVDSEPIWFAIECEFCAARGGRWTADDARYCVGRGIPETLRIMQARFGFTIDEDRDPVFVVDRFCERVASLELKRGCAELLDRARGRVPIAVASSSPRRLIDAVLARFELAPRFDAILSGEAVARPKPAPDLFLRVAADLGVEPSACVVIEDSLAGATAGRAAKMFVLAVPEGDARGRGFEEVSDAIVPSLIEAAEFLDLD